MFVDEYAETVVSCLLFVLSIEDFTLELDEQQQDAVMQSSIPFIQHSASD